MGALAFDFRGFSLAIFDIVGESDDTSNQVNYSGSR